jgi:hypothetical protein
MSRNCATQEYERNDSGHLHGGSLPHVCLCESKRRLMSLTCELSGPGREGRKVQGGNGERDPTVPRAVLHLHLEGSRQERRFRQSYLVGPEQRSEQPSLRVQVPASNPEDLAFFDHVCRFDSRIAAQAVAAVRGPCIARSRRLMCRWSPSIRLLQYRRTRCR